MQKGIGCGSFSDVREGAPVTYLGLCDGQLHPRALRINQCSPCCSFGLCHLQGRPAIACKQPISPSLPAPYLAPQQDPPPHCIPLGAPFHLDACLHLGLLQGGAQLLHLGGQGLHPLVHLPRLILLVGEQAVGLGSSARPLMRKISPSSGTLKQKSGVSFTHLELAPLRPRSVHRRGCLAELLLKHGHLPLETSFGAAGAFGLHGQLGREEGGQSRGAWGTSRERLTDGDSHDPIKFRGSEQWQGPSSCLPHL